MQSSLELGSRNLPNYPLRSIAVKEARDELTDYTIYNELSTADGSQKSRKAFAELSEMERKHYEFWERFVGSEVIRPKRATVYFVLLAKRVLGDSFAIRFLEHRERTTIKEYESLRNSIPENDKGDFGQIIEDEKGHETRFAEQVEQSYIKYVSFIILGLSDALVEIAGIHAGSLGIYNSTELSGLAGVVAGAAASVAMASAAYAQAKQGFQGSAGLAAGYTGGSYFVAAVILALPYFLTRMMIVAISSSVLAGVVIIAFVSWYNAIMSGNPLGRDFGRFAGIMLGATASLFVFGLAIRAVFGIAV